MLSRSEATSLAHPRREIVLAAGTAMLVTAANASQGAYFSQSWGWVALAFLIPTTLALILGHATRPEPARLAFLLLISAFAAWTALSVSWSVSEPASLREVERMVVYVSAALAIAVLFRRGDGPPVLAGVAVGTSLVATCAVATRLIPDRFPTYDDPSLDNRLAQPLGYPNALGVLCAIGLLLALAFVSHGGSIAALAASFSIPVQALALYFSFSRAAWGALALSCVVAVLLDGRWLRTLWMSCAVSVPSVLLVYAASRQEWLTRSYANVARAAPQGHRIAFALAGAMLGSAAVTWAAHLLARRVRVTTVGRRIATAVALGSIAVVLLVGIIAVGGPSQGAAHVRRSFETLPVGGTADLNGRLFQVYGSGRGEIWPVAWNEFASAPDVGTGAGSFEYVWYANRPTTRIVRDAHSLYLEVLAELGIVGCVLLVVALLLPVIAGIRARRSPLVAFATAAFLCWASAAAFDWHWEMVGLSVTAIVAGAAGFLARAPKDPPTLAGARTAFPLVATIVLTVLAVVSLVGNRALFAARTDLAGERWEAARSDALRARQLLPWSSEPDVALGDARAGLGDRVGALGAYRDAVAKDPQNWAAWLRVAQVASGDEQHQAYERVRYLNPREEDLPGDPGSSR